MVDCSSVSDLFCNSQNNNMIFKLKFLPGLLPISNGETYCPSFRAYFSRNRLKSSTSYLSSEDVVEHIENKTEGSE